MTDTSTAKKKTNRWLWPLLAALVLVGLGLWAFNRGADDGDLSERMASDPLSQEVTGGNPRPPEQPASSFVPDNANGNASVITEADAARANPTPGADPQSDRQPGARGPGADASGAMVAPPMAVPAPETAPPAAPAQR